MTFPTRYLSPAIAAVAGLVFLTIAHLLAPGVGAAPHGSMVEWVSACPAAVFTIAGTLFPILAVIITLFKADDFGSRSRY